MLSHVRALITATLFAACSTSAAGGGTPDADPTQPDADPTRPDAGPSQPDAGPLPADCSGITAYCSAWNVATTCAEVGGVPTWSDETCAGGCFAGACSSTECADECATGADCQLWDMSSQQFVARDAEASMHDRARGYDQVLRDTMLPAGGVANAIYADTEHTQISLYNGLIDSAIWTGSALAAQAWRARATGSADAVAQIRTYVDTLHRFFTVSGDTAYLARYAAPAGGADPLDIDCGAPRSHCETNWTWLGGISRDQYTGVMLGLWLAYHATPDADVLATIRDDVVALARELMTVHEDVPVKLVVDGTPFDLTMDMENVVLGPSDMQDGKVVIDLDTGNVAEASLLGAREFAPDLAPMLKQIPLLSWLPAAPRSGSAIMLGAIFRIAIDMSDDPELRAYYDAHADDWLAIADGWSYSGECGQAYYAIHISYIMAHAWALLEDDPTRRAHIRDDILDAKMWAYVSGHKNPYFAYLWGATRDAPSASAIAGANAQLAQFEAGPRVHIGRDNLASYPHHATCTQNGQPLAVESTAVEVGERVLSDFLWQRHPWGLQAYGNPYQTYPGVDYLAAYWLGRASGFLTEDRAGTCMRRTP